MGFAYIYLIFGICAIAVSIGKALAVNFGISKYLSKKPYEGDYNFKKVGYILWEQTIFCYQQLFCLF